MSAEPTPSKGASTNVAAPASSAAADVAAPASSVAAGQRGQQPATIRYVDRADMAETFADSSTASSSTDKHCASNLV